MTQYKIDMTFQELDPITEDDYLNVDHSAAGTRIFASGRCFAESYRLLMASYFRQVPNFDYVNRDLMAKVLATIRL